MRLWKRGPFAFSRDRRGPARGERRAGAGPDRGTPGGQRAGAARSPAACSTQPGRRPRRPAAGRASRRGLRRAAARAARRSSPRASSSRCRRGARRVVRSRASTCSCRPATRRDLPASAIVLAIYAVGVLASLPVTFVPMAVAVRRARASGRVRAVAARVRAATSADAGAAAAYFVRCC